MNGTKAPFLHFLGTGSGFSDSHNNAFWISKVKPPGFDEEQCLFLIDLSLLNFCKVVKLIEEHNLRYVVILLTHLHPDHASGIGTLMNWAEAERKFHGEERYIHVVCGDPQTAKDLSRYLNDSGTTAQSDHDSCCSILYMDTMFGTVINALYRKNSQSMFLWNNKEPRLEIDGEGITETFRPVAVTHGKMRSFGWTIKPRDGSLIVYTGDTDSIKYFDRAVIQWLKIVREVASIIGLVCTADITCYCVMETYPKSGRNMTVNGNIEEVLDRLRILYHESAVGSLRLVFMHYNDYDELARQLETSGFNDEVGKLSPKVSVEIATPAEI